MADNPLTSRVLDPSSPAFTGLIEDRFASLSSSFSYLLNHKNLAPIASARFGSPANRNLYARSFIESSRSQFDILLSHNPQRALAYLSDLEVGIEEAVRYLEILPQPIGSADELLEISSNIRSRVPRTILSEVFLSEGSGISVRHRPGATPAESDALRLRTAAQIFEADIVQGLKEWFEEWADFEPSRRTGEDLQIIERVRDHFNKGQYFLARQLIERHGRVGLPDFNRFRMAVTIPNLTKFQDGPNYVTLNLYDIFGLDEYPPDKRETYLLEAIFQTLDEGELPLHARSNMEFWAISNFDPGEARAVQDQIDKTRGSPPPRSNPNIYASENPPIERTDDVLRHNKGQSQDPYTGLFREPPKKTTKKGSFSAEAKAIEIGRDLKSTLSDIRSKITHLQSRLATADLSPSDRFLIQAQIDSYKELGRELQSRYKNLSRVTSSTLLPSAVWKNRELLSQTFIEAQLIATLARDPSTPLPEGITPQYRSYLARKASRIGTGVMNVADAVVYRTLARNVSPPPVTPDQLPSISNYNSYPKEISASIEESKVHGIALQFQQGQSSRSRSLPDFWSSSADRFYPFSVINPVALSQVLGIGTDSRVFRTLQNGFFTAAVRGRMTYQREALRTVLALEALDDIDTNPGTVRSIIENWTSTYAPHLTLDTPESIRETTNILEKEANEYYRRLRGHARTILGRKLIPSTDAAAVFLRDIAPVLYEAPATLSKALEKLKEPTLRPLLINPIYNDLERLTSAGPSWQISPFVAATYGNDPTRIPTHLDPEITSRIHKTLISDLTSLISPDPSQALSSSFDFLAEYDIPDPPALIEKARPQLQKTLALLESDPEALRTLQVLNQPAARAMNDLNRSIHTAYWSRLGSRPSAMVVPYRTYGNAREFSFLALSRLLPLNLSEDPDSIRNLRRSLFLQSGITRTYPLLGNASIYAEALNLMLLDPELLTLAHRNPDDFYASLDPDNRLALEIQSMQEVGDRNIRRYMGTTILGHALAREPNDSTRRVLKTLDRIRSRNRSVASLATGRNMALRTIAAMSKNVLPAFRGHPTIFF